MGQGNTQHLTHTWMEKMVQKPQYITPKGIQRAGGTEEKQKKSERLKKYNSKKKEFYTIDHTIQGMTDDAFCISACVTLSF